MPQEIVISLGKDRVFISSFSTVAQVSFGYFINREIAEGPMTRSPSESFGVNSEEFWLQ
jgi:hypothetical protein